MVHADSPLCLILHKDARGRRELTDDVLRHEVLPALQLPAEEYLPIFIALRHYWHEKMLAEFEGYMLCPVLQLRKILRTPGEWLKSGIKIADGTAEVYKNGSHQLVENAIPGIIDGGLVTIADELDRGVDILVTLPARLGRNGADVYDEVSVMARAGRFESLDYLANYGRPPIRRYLSFFRKR